MRTLLLLLSALLGAAGSMTACAAPPIVAVVAQNEGTEPTDYLVPFGVLAGSKLVDVRALAVGAGPVMLHPGDAQLEVQHTIDEFDRAVPTGADYVIVPAVHHPQAPRLLDWLRSQRAKGAVVMSVCDGAKVLAHAGLLEGREATAHWYALEDLRADFPGTRWRNDRRYVFGEGVASTSGVSASLPATLALLERIAGREPTLAYARTLGVERWSDAHDGAAFVLSGGMVRTIAANTLQFWRRERLGLEAPQGVEDAALALVLDAYSRTYRSSVVVRGQGGGDLRTRHGLVVRAAEKDAHRAIDSALLSLPLGEVLGATLDRISREYGARTAELVAVQLEIATASP
jgi:transcriptional regulator GlxA family with amidase domain